MSQKSNQTKYLVVVALGAVSLYGCAVDESSDSETTSESAEHLGVVSSAKSPSPDLGGPGTLRPNCVARVSSSEASCFPSFRAAIAFATEGMIVDAPEAKVALEDESFARRINSLGVKTNATVVIGIDYVNANFGGATFTWTAGSGCDGNPNTLDFLVSNLVPFGWNDVISSFRSFSNCQTVLFEHINFGGSVTQKAVDLSYVGDAMNDRATAIQWF